MKSRFRLRLLHWNNDANRRAMPWKGEKDPYKIWLSEIILQQTRVEQGIKYYQKFITAFPSIHELAKAPEKDVFKLWEGLGYYSRCKNLVATAKFISAKLMGKFPDTYQEIKSLKGVGPYTAAAISSFAYSLPHAVVDGNVVRVISRYFGISTPFNHEGKKLYSQLADALLDKIRPAAYNQAIMDFGAVICKPKQPLCQGCIQRPDCQAFRHNWVDLLPVKEKAIPKKVRWFYYFIIEYNNHLYIRKRKSKDIWENLYEFVLREYDSAMAFNDPALLQKQLEMVTGTTGMQLGGISEVYRQQLTHQTITGQFIKVKINGPSWSLEGYKAVPVKDLITYPFPKFICDSVFFKAMM